MVRKLKCHVFDPCSLNCDRLAYKNFLMQFENCVLGMQDKALKLLIKKKKTSQGSSLEDSHFSTDSLDTALEILLRIFG